MKPINCLPPVVDTNTRILILGTIPGKDSLFNKQYYANPDNIFWDIIVRTFRKDWDPYEPIDESITYQEKISLLLENNIGMWDIINSCIRDGSSDSKIKDPTYNDLEQLFISFPKIKKVLFGSKKAFDYFKKSKTKLPDNIEYRVMYSTSSLCPINAFYILKQWKNELLQNK